MLWNSRPTPILPVSVLKPVGPGPGGSRTTVGIPPHVPVSVIHCELLPGVACAAEEYRRSPTTATAAAAANRRLRRRGTDRGTVRRSRVVPSIAAGIV